MARFLYLTLTALLFCSCAAGIEENKICLTLIVKDEGETLFQCLNSAKKIIDYLCVCDAGASEESLRVVNDFFEETTIQGKVYKQAWKNQGHNTTIAALTAQQMLKDLGSSLPHTYLLFLSPYQEVHVGPEFSKKGLKQDAYQLFERSTGLTRYSMHLARASLLWQAQGSVWESWDSPTAKTAPRLSTLRVEEVGNENLVAQRLQGAVQELQISLREGRDEPHLFFYLAQAYKGLKKYDDAIDNYRLRLTKQGDPEEISFSKFMLGECYEQKQEWDRALYWYLEAFQERSNSTEPLRRIATHYRLHGKNDLAYLFAKHGSRIPFSMEQTYFTSTPLLHYQFDEEVSIAAYYTRFKEEGFLAADQLVLKKNVPWWVKNQCYQNILFYARHLKETKFKQLVFDFPEIEGSGDVRYQPMNPSILRDENGYRVICRVVNYTQKGAKEFHALSPDGIFRSRNFLLSYDTQFNLLSQHEIVDTLNRERFPAWNIEGFEDARPFHMQGEAWFTCTTCDTNPTGNRQISLCKLGEIPKEGVVNIEKLIPFYGVDLNRCEKNWLPFVKEGELHMIYSYDPFLIFRPNIVTGECPMVHYEEPVLDLTRFRGSAGPLDFDGGYLLLVHEVVVFPDHQRCYLHRFVHTDKQFALKSFSHPFTFQHQGVEYCCSMTVDHAGKNLVLPIGLEDSQAHFCTVSLETVRSLLHASP